MKVLVTGASGMLASNIIEELLMLGYEVRGVLRDKSKFKCKSHPNLELLEGDFKDYDTSVVAVSGCDAIIHAAAITAHNLIDYNIYQRVNVAATEQLIDIAVEGRVKRFIYVSSANTIGYGSPENPNCEDAPMKFPFTDSFYALSKKEAEAAVLSRSESIDVIVANPSFMVGRYGSLTGSNKILKMVRPLVFAPSGGKSFIDVRDAAVACIKLLGSGKSGERYLICGENLSFKSFFQRFEGVRYVFVIPNFILSIVGRIGNLLRALGLTCDISSVNIKMLTINPGYRGAKLENATGFKPQNICGAEIMQHRNM